MCPSSICETRAHLIRLAVQDGTGKPDAVHSENTTTDAGSIPSPSLAANTATNARRPSSSSRSPSFSLPSRAEPVRPGGKSPDGRRQSAGSPNLHTQNRALAEGEPTVPAPLGATHMNTLQNSGEVFDDSDEELDEEAKARQKEFEKNRKQHYSKEAAFAMKKARELLQKDEEEEEEEEEDHEDDGGMDIDAQPNGLQLDARPNGAS